MDEFRAKHAGNDKVMSQLQMPVKKCQCGKPCAYTMSNCNSCGASLQSVEVSYVDNVFMGFVYGVGAGKFPYTVSLRRQSTEFMAFDDPLALSVCHLNSIPTSVYIADFRYLFTDPTRGLQLINRMFEFTSNAVIECFWSNEAFRKKFLANEPVPQSTEELVDIVAAGMNFPPSIAQLHLQYILPPMLPFHYALTRDEVHFQYGRFFPFKYLRKALELGDKVKMEITPLTQLSEILEKVASHGVNYDEYQIGMVRQCFNMQKKYAPWSESDFSAQVVNGKVLNMDTMQFELDQDPKAIQAADTKLIQNYGRPYDAAGKPTGSFYQFAKQPEDVEMFVDAA